MMYNFLSGVTTLRFFHTLKAIWGTLSTWIPKEYELNKTYADDTVAFSDYLKELREEVRKDTMKKIGE